MELDVVKILKDMVKLNTTNPSGNEYLMTEYIGKILDEYSIEYEIIEKEKNRTNIIATIGNDTGKAPITFISHTDVVEAKIDAWENHPFSAYEEDGMIYGRGTLDTKFLTAVSLVTFIKLSKENLNRRIIFIATADEEQGSQHGMPHVVSKYKDLLANSYVLNEGGGFYIQNRDKDYYLVTVGEKGRCDVKVKLNGRPSASSFPNDNKSTHKMFDLITRLSDYEFPHEDNAVYNKFISTIEGEIDSEFLKHFASYNRQNKIIISDLNAGVASNIIPQCLELNFSVQLMPRYTLEDAKHLISDILNGLDVEYEITNFLQGFESESSGGFFVKMAEVVRKYFCREADLLPVYALGRTDGRFLGALPCNVYGFSLVSKVIPFESVIQLVHNVDEKIDVNSLLNGVEAYFELCKYIGVNDEK